MKIVTAFLGFAAGRFDGRLGYAPMPRRGSVMIRAAGEEDAIDNRNDRNAVSRRSLFHTVGTSIAGTVSSGPLSALLHALSENQNSSCEMMANAMGLVQFPCPPGELSNTYHMMRAGESILEADGILSTNPLFLTNREDALSELGIVQVEEACRVMMSRGINPSVVKYSLASKCIETANIVATTLLVGR
jgi:hypothetical protein